MSTQPKAEPRAMRARGAERILPLACIVSAIVLATSEFLTTFEFVPAGGDPIGLQHAYTRHHYAILLIGLFGLGATIVAVVFGSKPAAVAVAVAGAIGLLVFLIVDLPDANNVGTLNTDQFFNAKAVPQPGFWLELIGSLGLALAGTALATLNPMQLHSLRPKWLLGSGTLPGAAEPFDQHDDADELGRRRDERDAKSSGG
jgi:hypothetical protein